MSIGPELQMTIISALDALVPMLRELPREDLFRQVCVVYVTDESKSCDLFDPVKEFADKLTVEVAAGKNMLITSVMLLSQAADDLASLRAIGVGQPIMAVDVPQECDPKGTPALHIYLETPDESGFFFFGLEDGILASSPVPLPPFRQPPQLLKKAAVVKKFQEQWNLPLDGLRNKWLSGLATPDPEVDQLAQSIRAVDGAEATTTPIVPN